MSARGTYALLLSLDGPQCLCVGALGAVDFPTGWYLYLGSAYGPGGLAARLARHRRHTGKRLHWHIDYLRAVAALVDIWSTRGDTRQECHWAATAAALPGALAIPGFGASDCRCPAHLFHYMQPPECSTFERLVGVEVERELIEW